MAKPLKSRPEGPLATLARFLDTDFLPAIYGRRMGFSMVIFDFTDLPEDGQIDYVSNAERKDMIVAMKEFISKHEGMNSPASETKQ